MGAELENEAPNDPQDAPSSRSILGKSCLICDERADHWHHVITTEPKILLNVALCSRCHIRLHQLEPKHVQMFLRKLKKTVRKVKYFPST